MREPRTIRQRVTDLDQVEVMINRLATTDDEAAAARRVLGVQDEAERLSTAYAPDLPPPAPVGVDIDHEAHARAAVDRYQAWVDSHPDDNPVPLPERQRALRLARVDLARLALEEGTP